MNHGEPGTELPKSEAIEAHNRYQRFYYETTNKRTMQPTGSPYVQRQLDRFVAAADLRPDQAILEVGCGQGRYTIPLLDRGYQVTGLDLSPVLLQRLRDAASDRPVELVAGDVAEAGRQFDRRFDRVIGFFALHHMHDFDLVFRGISRVLKPGGVLALLEPVAWNPLYYLQIAVTPRMTWRGDGGVAKMRPGLVHPALRRQGFDDCRTESFGFFPPFLTNTRVGRSVEDFLQKRGWTRPAHAFQIFMARLAG